MGRGFKSSRQRQFFEDASLLERFLIAIPAGSGRYPSGQRGQTVNLLAYAFGGSNPPLPTTVSSAVCSGWVAGGLAEVRVAPIAATTGHMAVRTVHVAVRRMPGNVRGNSSAVERQPSKLGVAGSNPVSRSMVASAACSVRTAGGLIERRVAAYRAHVAQLAERVLGKDEVSGSNPDMGSSFRSALITPVDGR